MTRIEDAFARFWEQRVEACSDLQEEPCEFDDLRALRYRVNAEATFSEIAEAVRETIPDATDQEVIAAVRRSR